MAIKQPDYLENKAELTQAGQAASAPSLTEQFSAYTRDNDDLLGLHSKSKAGLQEKGQALAKSNDENRQHEAEKAKTRMDDLLLLELLDLENDIAAQYGENFALDLLEDMYQHGLITEEERDRIRAIEDVNEQRHATALAYQDAKDDGKVPAGFEDRHEWLSEDWLDKHKQHEESRNHQVVSGLKCEISTDDMIASAKNKANVQKASDGNSEGLSNEFQKATVEQEHQAASADSSFVNNFENLDLNGMGKLG
ncbi:MAG: hypothetical protein KZQ96_20980 [Candidatus Thiodiazotropha sp. (ex Lucinoma borealis)]|nr:hypothetical protein [Candidatus Thiodiazotropha sp. (ex Lucinoma borealis)]